MTNGQPLRQQAPLSWTAISGKWKFDSSTANYQEGTTSGSVAGRPVSLGMALTNQSIQDGRARIKVIFDSLAPDDLQGGGFVIEYRSSNERYLIAQLAASQAAYSIAEFLPGFGWQAIVTAGEKANLQPNREYLVEVSLRGQRISLDVDGVRIFGQILRAPLQGKQLGVIASGSSPVHFKGLGTESEQPSVFVAMQFGEPFDTIYKQVIQPGVSNLGVQVIRIDEVAGPGIVFEDIQRNISESRSSSLKLRRPIKTSFMSSGTLMR